MKVGIPGAATLSLSPMATAISTLAAAASSRHYDTRTAATEIAHRLSSELAAAPDVVLLFGSYHHSSAFAEAGGILRRELGAGALVGTTAESVIAESRELEGLAGLSALALRLPGASVTSFRFDLTDMPGKIRDAGFVAERMGMGADRRATIVFADPYSTPMTLMLRGLSAATESSPGPVIGGMASGASQPGLNVLLCGDEMLSSGAVGLTITGGKTAVDVLVSQGCRSIGSPMVVTKVKDNVIVELGGRPAMEVAREVAESLPESQKRLLSRGLFIGVVVNEYKPRFGRGDFLIRGVMGVQQQVQGLVIGEAIQAGRTVQFHVRDNTTASEDLQLLLDAEQLKAPPSAVMLVSCNGRGSRLFPTPHHDASTLRTRLGDPPLAGFFAAGEIGPIGGRPFLHGQTACAAILRPAKPVVQG